MTTKAQLLKIIRKKCLWCSNYQVQEIRKCPCKETCALWPFRMGKDPKPSKRGFAARKPQKKKK